METHDEDALERDGGRGVICEAWRCGARCHDDAYVFVVGGGVTDT